MLIQPESCSGASWSDIAYKILSDNRIWWWSTGSRHVTRDCQSMRDRVARTLFCKASV